MVDNPPVHAIDCRRRFVNTNLPITLGLNRGLVNLANFSYLLRVLDQTTICHDFVIAAGQRTQYFDHDRLARRNENVVGGAII